MTVHLLSDVDVVAISLVDKGANRRKFYLRKQDGPAAEEFEVPGPARLIKTDDWSAVYCVVAEPGWRENPGIGSLTDLEDEWESADEIRKAAHRFMKNGALVNKMHETLEPYGNVVENFVSQSTFLIGEELVKEGAWVVGISPTDEGKAAIEKGEFTGISIQGTGVRKRVEKAQLPPGAEKDSKGAQGPKAKKCPECGSTVKSEVMVCQNCGHKFGGAPVKKGEARQEGTLTPVEDHESTGWLRAIGSKLGITKEDVGQFVEEKEEDVVSEASSDEKFAEVQDAIAKNSKQVETLANRLADIVELLAGRKKEEEVAQPTTSEVYHRLEEVQKSLDEIHTDVEKLGSGTSSQPAEERRHVVKSDHPLSGILFED